MTESHTDRLIQYYTEESARSLVIALDTIDDAVRELEHVRKQLVLASEGQPYLRVGQIRGVNAGDVFVAFGQIETLAATQRITEEE